MDYFGVRLLGFNTLTAHRILLTLGFIVAIYLLRKLIVFVLQLVTGKNQNERVIFWTRQGLSLFTALAVTLAILSIWFDSPERLATGLGLLTAGLAFALQRVITAIAAYIVIMRGNTFSVGDRITMGGVRGDVIALGFIQTTIMEMGQPPEVEPNATPAMWIHGRQFTGRIVTVTNDKIFDEPIYNYTREFPFIWEELKVPIPYTADRRVAERALLEAAQNHTAKYDSLSQEDRERLSRKYFLKIDDFKPRVFITITDNWVEMSLRILCPDHGVREIKDAISRDILDRLSAAGIGIASGTYDVVGFPPIRIEPAAIDKVIAATENLRNAERSGETQAH